MRAGLRLWKGKPWRKTIDVNALNDTEMLHPLWNHHERVIIIAISHDYLITHRVLLSYDRNHTTWSKLLVIRNLAEQVEAEGASRSVSTDGLAEGLVQATLLRGGLVGADGNRIDDTESKSLCVICQHLESLGL